MSRMSIDDVVQELQSYGYVSCSPDEARGLLSENSRLTDANLKKILDLLQKKACLCGELEIIYYNDTKYTDFRGVDKSTGLRPVSSSVLVFCRPINSDSQKILLGHPLDKH